MIQRCTNPNSDAYPDYGGRGVKVCDRWRGPSGFQNFYADMGPRPSKKHEVDRFPNNDGNYEPSNCRWTTRKPQMRNMRANHNLTYKGRTMCLVDWANELGMTPSGLLYRVRKWGVERAISTPVTKKAK